MPLNFTPLSWKNVDPENRDQMKVFLLQISDFLNSAFNPAFLAFSLNGQRLIKGNALIFKDAQLGTVGTNQTVDCTGAAHVMVSITITASLTLNLTNLDTGVPVFIQAINNTAGVLTLKCTASNPASVSYQVFEKVSGGAPVDFVATGAGLPATSQAWFWGLENSVALLFEVV